jgi:hypothetical protein
MGGMPPLGYRVQDRKLVIVDGEAEIVRSIFRRYAELGSVRLLKAELEARGVKSKSWTSASGRLIGGKAFSRGALYLMAAEPSLSGRDRSQGTIPPRRTHADYRSADMGYGSGAACRQYRRALLRHPHCPAEPARRHAV